MKDKIQMLYRQLEEEKKRKTNVCSTYGTKEKKENIKDIKADIKAEKKRIVREVKSSRGKAKRGHGAEIK